MTVASQNDGLMPRVSVITIFLNAAPYLESAVRSVCAQSYQDWELLLVDDGSTDGSSEMALKWASSHPGRIRYLEHPGHANLGMSASRNLGLRTASGEYVALLDADDVYLIDRLARHVQILEQMQHIDMVQSDQMYWYDWKDRRGREQRELCSRQPLFVGDAIIHAPAGLLGLFGVPDAFTAPCSVTIRREAALDLGGWEDSFRGLYEDQVFMTKVYARKSVYALQAILAWYRLHDGGAVATTAAKVRSVKGEYFQAARRLRSWQARYLANVAGMDPVVMELLEHHLLAASDARVTRVRAVSMLTRHAAHWASRRLLPSALYRKLLHKRQQWSARRCAVQHADLCRRMADVRLARATAS